MRVYRDNLFWILLLLGTLLAMGAISASCGPTQVYGGGPSGNDDDDNGDDDDDDDNTSPTPTTTEPAPSGAPSFETFDAEISNSLSNSCSCHSGGSGGYNLQQGTLNRHGTIDGATVYPREIVKRALQLNAGAVILAHNHPSGDCEPSIADQAITKRIVDALKLVDIRTLDHVIVGAGFNSTSMKERGLL